MFIIIFIVNLVYLFIDEVHLNIYLFRLAYIQDTDPRPLDKACAELHTAIMNSLALWLKPRLDYFKWL